MDVIDTCCLSLEYVNFILLSLSQCRLKRVLVLGDQVCFRSNMVVTSTRSIKMTMETTSFRCRGATWGRRRAACLEVSVYGKFHRLWKFHEIRIQA